MSQEDDVKGSVKHFIIYFGLLEGIWINTGVHPFLGVLNAFEPFLGSSHSWYVGVAKLIFFLLIPLIQIIAIYIFGGIIGGIALVVVFLGGVFITSWAGVLLAVGGILLAYYAFSKEKDVKISLNW